MATVTKPIALDESLNTTELSSRNVADVLAQELQAVAGAIGGMSAPSAEDVSYDNSGSGLSATDVQDAIDELASEKVDKEVGKGLSTNDYTTAEKTKLAGIEAGAEVNPTSSAKTATESFETVNGGLLSKCQINLVPVQSGSGDPSPDNVRPISGHTEVDLYNVGKNKLPLVLANIKSLNTSGTWSGNAYTQNGGTFIVLTDSASNIVGVNVNGTFSTATRFYLYRSAVEAGSYIINGGISDDVAFGLRGDSSLVYSTGSDKAYTISADKADAEANVVAAKKTFNNVVVRPMLRLSTESDATFEPYLGHLYQVQIGSTVYGGYVDLVSGVMTATHGFITLNGTENITKLATTSCDIYIYTITPANFSQPFITSAFKYSSTAISAVGYAWRGTSDTQIRIGYAEYGTTTVNDFKTWLSNNPLQICYELATPFTIHLTPQQIETLAGQNNLSTPLDGQSIETNGVEYKELFTFADVKEYVDKKIPDAPTTDGTYTLQAVVSGGVPTYSWV